MHPHPRYEILAQIAVGDFATVFRARDKELNREVAIKQIHPQFLADQRQLERYWQEAQLLASLEHPNIMTIYDIDRSRGWLILELMNGSLSDHAAGKPLDLDALRLALVCSLQALKFLHQNGIIHGDVKPSNLMIDRRNMVKLGDFGLAQRAANDQGSLLKGTTKYIAPERVSDQFGPVGPASDLYSLGFSMYELMCGEQFESLFPGLNAFGRDMQIAWIMWHSAADRQAPEINRVLEGVPEDLAHVIQRLICKDPNKRFSSAEQVIAELKASMGYGPQPPTDEEMAAAAAAEEARQKRRRRKRLMVAAAVSAVMCLAMVLWPKPEVKISGPKLSPADGVVMHLYPDTHRVGIKMEKSRRTIVLREGDQLYLNDRVADFSALKKDDHLRVIVQKDDTGKAYQEIRASRPRLDRGVVASVQPSRSTFVLNYTQSDGEQADRILLVPDDVKIKFNGKTTFRGKPFKAANLKTGDRVVVTHDTEDEHRVVRELSITRVVTIRGTAQGVDTDAKTITLVTGDNSANRITLPLSSRCEVIINGRQFVQDRPLQPADLTFGDQVEVHHDTHVVKIVAARVRDSAGVIRQIVPTRRMVEIAMDGSETAKSFALSDQCDVRLADAPVGLEELQSGDRVRLSYDASDPDRPVATQLHASRPINRDRWAVVIGVYDYDDQALSAVDHIRGDVRRVHEALIDRYAVATDQALLLENSIRTKLQQNVSDFLKRIPEQAQVIVYFVGHAYLDVSQTPFLAARDFELLRIDQSGLPLQWLIDQVEDCDAAEKIILLDTCHPVSGADRRKQPSSQELFSQLDKNPQKAALTTARVIASCQKGQRGEVREQEGQFAAAIASGFQGDADRDGDNVVKADELYSYLSGALRSRTDGRQMPAIFGPREVEAPRLSEEALVAVRELAVMLGGQEMDTAAAAEVIQRAEAAAPDQPEPMLLAGLVQLKTKEFDKAIKTFSSAYRKYPQQLLPIEGMIWGLYQRRQYRDAVSGLVLLVDKTPKQIGADGQLPVETRRILAWAGRLREFAGAAVPDKYKPPATELEKIDQVVAASGPGAAHLYNSGRELVRNRLKEIDKQIAETSDKGIRLKLEKFERPRLRNYASYSIEAAAQGVLRSVGNRNASP